jgi:hypothetical protein
VAAFEVGLSNGAILNFLPAHGLSTGLLQAEVLALLAGSSGNRRLEFYRISFNGELHSQAGSSPPLTPPWRCPFRRWRGRGFRDYPAAENSQT